MAGGVEQRGRQPAPAPLALAGVIGLDAQIALDDIGGRLVAVDEASPSIRHSSSVSDSVPPTRSPRSTASRNARMACSTPRRSAIPSGEPNTFP